jgi:hypothetical protein
MSMSDKKRTAAKLAYSSPKITRYGRLSEITKANSTTGKGDGGMGTLDKTQ